MLHLTLEANSEQAFRLTHCLRRSVIRMLIDTVMAMSRQSLDERAKDLKTLIEKGVERGALAELLNVSDRTLRRIASAAGLGLPDRRIGAVPHHTRAAITRVEAHTGKCVRDSLLECREQRMTMKAAADAWGVSEAFVQREAARQGIRWPRFVGEAHRRSIRDGCQRYAEETASRVMVFGQDIRVSQAALLIGMSESGFRRRLTLGVSANIARRPSNTGRRKRHYSLGLSEADYAVIIPFAREHGIQKASRTFGIPYGAVSAALRGDYERLD